MSMEDAFAAPRPLAAMPATPLRERVLELIRAHYCLRADDHLADDTPLATIGDSLDLVELELELGEVFGFELSEANWKTEVDRLVTVADVVSLVEQAGGGR
jgi:acyl carrier protein